MGLCILYCNKCGFYIYYAFLKLGFNITFCFELWVLIIFINLFLSLCSGAGGSGGDGSNGGRGGNGRAGSGEGVPDGGNGGNG